MVAYCSIDHIPGTAFGDSGEGHIRISYATSMERIKQFIKTLKTLCVFA